MKYIHKMVNDRITMANDRITILIDKSNFLKSVFVGNRIMSILLPNGGCL